MWAIVNNRYGSPDDLKLHEIDKPTVGDDAVLTLVGVPSSHGLCVVLPRMFSMIGPECRRLFLAQRREA